MRYTNNLLSKLCIDGEDPAEEIVSIHLVHNIHLKP
jgi:hypothetical protein